MQRAKLSAEARKRQQQEQRVVSQLLAGGSLAVVLESACLSAEELPHRRFTLYGYNLLQLAVYFQSSKVISKLYENRKLFIALLNGAKEAADSIYRIICLRHAADLFKFFFDILPIEEDFRGAAESARPLWAAASPAFLADLWAFLLQLQANLGSLTHVQAANFAVLHRFFLALRAGDWPADFPLRDQLALQQDTLPFLEKRPPRADPDKTAPPTCRSAESLTELNRPMSPDLLASTPVLSEPAADLPRAPVPASLVKKQPNLA